MQDETPDVDRADIIARLFRVLEYQVKSLEKDIDMMRAENRSTGDKEAALLGKLAGDLEKLIELDDPERSGKRKLRGKAVEDLRSKLVERIEHLRRQ